MHWDVIIVGAGMGGSACVSQFSDTNLRILILERGDWLKTEAANWDPEQVILQGKYEPEDFWLDENDKEFRPRVYYNVGGCSKFFGASAYRLREEDFTRDYSPWPITYQDLAPWYDQAELAMKVHGLAGADPTEAERKPYPFKPLEHEPVIADLERRLKKRGLHPFPLPVAVDQGPGGRCRKGSPCDGFPCRIRAKGDAENAFLRPSMKKNPNITVRTNMKVSRLTTTEDGLRIQSIHVEGSEGSEEITAKLYILAAGAVNTAAILLRSSSTQHPDGLCNRSGKVGKHFMTHINSVMMAFRLFRKNPTRFQKTLAINDFYHPGNQLAPKAAGSIQMRGKIQPENLAKHPSWLVRLFRNFLAHRSVDFWMMSEDIGRIDEGVSITRGGKIKLVRKTVGTQEHRHLVRYFKKVLRKCGFSLILIRPPRPDVIQHQCGTVRFGNNPDLSVLNPECRSWDIDNLYVCDASIFPSSGAINPALTVAANALRVGAIIREKLNHPSESH